MKRTMDRTACEEPRLAGARELVPVRDGNRERGLTIADVLGRFMLG
ncbi:MAG: hypothetical protein HPY65_16270 [Syntrophaceae bacterium]|nr:hypothetical protein [Syntrophaceae bacterium]